MNSQAHVPHANSYVPHIGVVAARSGATVEHRTSTEDVALAYSAAARDARTGARTFSKAGKLELQLIYRDGWVVLDNDQHGRALLSILLHTIANAVRNLPAKLEAARKEFAPWLPDEEMVKLATEAIRVRRRWTADKFAQRIGLTYADRQRLGVTMIGATDMPKARARPAQGATQGRGEALEAPGRWRPTTR